MKRFLQNLAALLGSTLFLFVLLEIIFRLIGAPGTSRFAEKIILKEHLTARKPAGEFRIFAYGESTIHGSHYGPYSNTMRWCEAYLRDALPGRRIKVVNFGRIGQGSDFIRETFEDTLFYKPDLAVFYMGHNDFLFGNRLDQSEAEQKSFGFWLRRLVRKSYFLSTVSRWVIAGRMKRKKDVEEDRMEYGTVETPPMGVGAENAVPRNSQKYRDNVEHFQNNIERICRLAERRRLPIVFFKPVSNLKDFAPFYSLHEKSLTPRELRQWQEWYQAGLRAEEAGNTGRALECFRKAYAIDPTYADLAFRMGSIAFKEGELAEAKLLFEQARDSDGIIYRAPREILKVFEDLHQKYPFDYLDTEKVLIAEVPGGILGEPVIEDNVHFSIRGHSLTGKALLELIRRRGWIAPAGEWRLERERPFEAVAAELGVNDELLYSADLKMVVYFGSRFDNRLRFAKRALQLKPGDPTALRHLAWTLWLMGKKDEAIQVYGQLERVEPRQLEEVFKNKPEIKEAFEAAEAA